VIGIMSPSPSHQISALPLPQPSLFDHEQHATYPKAEASLKAVGILAEAVELTSASSTDIISSSKITASSKGASSQRWASFRSRARGERGPGYCVRSFLGSRDPPDMTGVIWDTMGSDMGHHGP